MCGPFTLISAPLSHSLSRKDNQVVVFLFHTHETRSTPSEFAKVCPHIARKYVFIYRMTECMYICIYTYMHVYN